MVRRWDIGNGATDLMVIGLSAPQWDSSRKRICLFRRLGVQFR